MYDTSASAAAKGSFGAESLESTSNIIIREYHPSSKYWYFYTTSVDTTYSGDVIEDIFDKTAEDSIQFLHDAIPVQWPDPAELTGIRANGSYSEYAQLHPETLLISQNLTVVGDIADTGHVVVAGNGQVTAAGDFESDSLGSCHGSFVMTQTISNVEINLVSLQEEGCPTAGAVSYNGTAEMECDGDGGFSYSDGWIITQTFSGDNINTVLENSTTIWTVTDTCDGGTAAPRDDFTNVGSKSSD